MFRALEPKIHFNNAYNDVPRFVTNIKIFCAKEKNKSPGLDDDTGRQKALVKILMDKLKPDEETLLTTSVFKMSSDMKLVLYKRKTQLSDPQSNRLCANSVLCSKNLAVLVLLVA